MTATTLTDAQRGTGEYADVNGLHIYYESHGPVDAARTLVLLHGGLESGERWGPVLPALGEGRRVIVPDLQGHGRTADIDRPIDFALMADDIAGLIEHLGIEKTDVLGYSLGGGVAYHLIARHPEVIGKAIVLSAPIRRDAIYADMLVQQERVSSAAVPFMQETPMWELYQRVAPKPENFGLLLDKIGASMAKDSDLSDLVRSLTVPTLIACADADMAPPAHYAEIFQLLGGGLRDGGWMGEGRPAGGHALAVIPNATHYNVNHSPVLVAAAKAFLDA